MDKKIGEFTMNMTLKIISSGSNPTNFKIIESLPNNIKEIQKKFKLTKMPVNKRINQLERNGLLKRDRGTGELFPTKLTKVFIRLMKELKKDVDKNMFTLLNNSLNIRLTNLKEKKQ